MGTFGYSIAVVSCIFFAAFAAGSETAVVSCSKVRLAELARRGSWRARSIEQLLGKPERFFAVVLVSTNVAVIACTAAATELSISFFGESGAVVATAVMVPVLLIFGEVIPKSLFLYHADRVAVAVAPGLKFLEILLWPLVQPASALVRALLGAGSMGAGRFNILSTREELVYMYRMGKRKEELDTREQLIIDRVFRFKEVRARDILVPLERVVFFSEKDSVSEVASRIDRYPFSRFPVLSEDGKTVVGIIALVDLLGLDGGEKLTSVMHRPLFARETDSAEKLLVQMKDETMHMAIVIGERGQIRGIVTLEDILESIIGAHSVKSRASNQPESARSGYRFHWRTGSQAATKQKVAGQ